MRLGYNLKFNLQTLVTITMGTHCSGNEFQFADSLSHLKNNLSKVPSGDSFCSREFLRKSFSSIFPPKKVAREFSFDHNDYSSRL